MERELHKQVSESKRRLGQGEISRRDFLRYSALLGLSLAAKALSACRPASLPTPTPFPTYTPYPTYTPFPTPTPAPMPKPTPTPEERRPISLEALRAKEGVEAREAMYYAQLGSGVVKCELCPRGCILTEGQKGVCRARKNIGGKLHTLTYGQPCVVMIDPIEKGPIFHMTPGAQSLTIATAGCNLKCKYCQNWQFSQVGPEQTENYDLPPEDVVELALSSGAEAIVFTYTEPTIYYEYMLDTAKLAKGKGLKTVMITGGYINPEPLKGLSKHMDAIKVDLKGFSEKFYREVCGGELWPVLETIKQVREEGGWLEVVNLVIPGLNDDLQEIGEMCEWIRDNLGTDVPLHFSRFFPAYKLSRHAPTPVSTLEQAIQIAKDMGLKYVYIGNVPGHEAGNTYCPKCGKLLIKRIGYTAVLENNIVDGKCKFCGHEIPGVWK